MAAKVVLISTGGTIASRFDARSGGCLGQENRRIHALEAHARPVQGDAPDRDVRSGDFDRAALAVAVDDLRASNHERRRAVDLRIPHGHETSPSRRPTRQPDAAILVPAPAPALGPETKLSPMIWRDPQAGGRSWAVLTSVTAYPDDAPIGDKPVRTCASLSAVEQVLLARDLPSSTLVARHIPGDGDEVTVEFERGFDRSALGPLADALREVAGVQSVSLDITSRAS